MRQKHRWKAKPDSCVLGIISMYAVVWEVCQSWEMKFLTMKREWMLLRYNVLVLQKRKCTITSFLNVRQYMICFQLKNRQIRQEQTNGLPKCWKLVLRFTLLLLLITITKWLLLSKQVEEKLAFLQTKRLVIIRLL